MTRDERVAQWELLFEIEEGLPPFIAECVEQVVARETQRLSNPRQTSSPVWRPFLRLLLLPPHSYTRIRPPAA